MFGVPTLVSIVSEFATLEPGDLILTGTPGGVGYRREPQRLLEDGDVVAVEIEGVGRIENRVAAEAAGDPARCPRAYESLYPATGRTLTPDAPSP